MERFFDRVRALFGGRLTQLQVEGISRLVGATYGLPLRHRAYILATAMHETARTMQPVRETLAGTDDAAVARLEAAWRKGQLQWVKTPYWRPDADGKAWFGRGYVQLTHRANYKRAGDELGIDLVSNPAVAMRPDVAVLVLVRGMTEGWFTGKKLADYSSYEDMRRVVNGTDRAADIAALARGFEDALGRLDAWPSQPPLEAPPQPDPDTTIVRPIARWAGLAFAILIILIIIFGR